ncbi:importin beta subunit [Pelomyxa schiedti]|nr:importin beta subunit [Pelomyxa schiedti]
MADLTSVLLAAQSENQAVRVAAEQQLKQAEQQNLPQYLVALAQELGSDHPVLSRRLAGLNIKNLFTGKDEGVVAEQQARWVALDVAIKGQVKTIIMQVLSSPVADARHSAAQIINCIAQIELPRKEWPELMPTLCQNATTTNEFLRQSSLEAIGYICEEIDDELLAASSNQILTAVVSAATPDQANMDIKRIAVQALLNSLSFAKGAFEREVERTYLMRVLLEATRAPDNKVKEYAFQCLVKVASLYYSKLDAYIQGIFNMTILAIKNETEQAVVLQAIEFWSTLAEVETQLAAQAEEEGKTGANSPCKNYVLGALQYLIEALWTTLLKQEEDEDEDTWNISCGGGTCLALISLCVRDAIVPIIMPVISQNIQNSEWRAREAATLAFGSVLEGPARASLHTFIVAALPILMKHMADPNDMVKDTTAWALGRIFQHHKEEVGENLHNVIATLFTALDTSSSLVSANICWAVHIIAESYDSGDSATSPMSPVFQYCVQGLIKASQRKDADDDKLRCSAYAAINTLVHCCAKDCITYVSALVPVCVQKIQTTLAAPPKDSDEKREFAETQALLTVADALMFLYLQILGSTNSSVNEEALMAVGSLCNAVEGDFVKYLGHFMPRLLVGLRNSAEYEACCVAIGVVGDLCRALANHMTPYAAEIVKILLDHLLNPEVDRSIKPPIFSTFGDLAMSIAGDFLPFLPSVIQMLQQASVAKLEDSEDDDQIDYLNQLRESICEGYTGILQGLRACNRANDVISAVEPMLSLVSVVLDDPNKTESLTRCVVGLLGDLAHSLGPNVKRWLATAAVIKVLDDVRAADYSETTQNIATWAKELITQLM